MIIRNRISFGQVEEGEFGAEGEENRNELRVRVLFEDNRSRERKRGRKRQFAREF